MERALAARLPDGRLHLQHGPIDLIISIEGPGTAMAEVAVVNRFEHVLEDLVEELPILRAPAGQEQGVTGIVAGRMMEAVHPFLPAFVTPMAAVAGSVADEMIATIRRCGGITKAVVNNGGDVAVHLAPGAETTAIIAGTNDRLTLTADQPWRGVATSGWRGRSWSLGIADAVTVIARTAATADAAATMIGNQVDLPGHPAISRAPAESLASESDLCGLHVTTDVAPLSRADIDTALGRGAVYAGDLQARGVIGGAILLLQGEARTVGASAPVLRCPEKEAVHG
ncbi:MAG: UPF0280 family protein [Pseudomonadota bacterium]